MQFYLTMTFVKTNRFLIDNNNNVITYSVKVLTLIQLIGMLCCNDYTIIDEVTSNYQMINDMK